ncbi:PREDICTED: uncharacterized protein LOC106328045 [Brassica oleracea var. oleracea]|uniref:MATH domain-containing protein n=1 Tax=Brassica oleracea var. oleracea TaxID=109376 RepID=A0A0D3B4M8_BRAOL|nr:PREDICTED: uncharacterized protein LOC106328045 [Brassica oleracea var. oleracea]
MGQTLSLEDTIRAEAKSHNNVHLMLVDGMSKLMTRQVENCVSSDFYVGGLKWNIVILQQQDCLYFVLVITDSKCIGSNWKVNCNVKLTIYSATSPFLNQNRGTWFCFDANNTTLLVSIPVKNMQEYTVNDKSVFSAEITNVNPQSLDVGWTPRTMGTAESIKLMEVERNKSKFTWKITHFSTFVGEHHSSYQFTVGPRKWYLRMYPKGTSEGKGNSLSLYLHAPDYVTGPNTKTLAVFKLRVLDQLKRNHHEIGQQFWFGTDGQKGEPKFLALEELHKASNGYLVNDQIYIGVEFFYISATQNMI